MQKNIDFNPTLKLSGWRKIAIGTWKTTGDPSVYGSVELDAQPLVDHVEKLRTESGVHVTLTHVVGKILALAIKRHPEINCILRFSRLYPRKTVDIFFQVATDVQGADLSGTVIRNADQKSVLDIAREMNEKAMAIREKRDLSYTKLKNLARILPGFFSRILLNIGGFIMYTLNIWSPLIGAPRDAFGSMMVTNIGSLGLDEAYAPLVPYSRVPLIIVVGAVRENALVRDGNVIAGKTIKLCATFDHRLIDGVYAGHLARTLKELFADPQKLEGLC